ncbi:MAG: response regulator [Desulfamplus sp.]|nr:response regulator [Desulfamplus sp.]
MKHLNIMVVDDSAITIKKLTKIIEEIGHSVVGSAKTGRDAVEKYKESKPDIVTMDITMPDMDGIEATRLILEHDSRAIIIMITSHGQEKMVIDAVEAGALGYVIKPIKADKLKESIDKIANKFWKQ